MMISPAGNHDNEDNDDVFLAVSTHLPPTISLIWRGRRALGTLQLQSIRLITMALTLNGSSEHVGYVSRKIGIFQIRFKFVAVADLNKCLRQIKLLSSL